MSVIINPITTPDEFRKATSFPAAAGGASFSANAAEGSGVGASGKEVVQELLKQLQRNLAAGTDISLTPEMMSLLGPALAHFQQTSQAADQAPALKSAPEVVSFEEWKGLWTKCEGLFGELAKVREEVQAKRKSGKGEAKQSIPEESKRQDSDKGKEKGKDKGTTPAKEWNEDSYQVFLRENDSSSNLPEARKTIDSRLAGPSVLYQNCVSKQWRKQRKGAVESEYASHSLFSGGVFSVPYESEPEDPTKPHKILKFVERPEFYLWEAQDLLKGGGKQATLSENMHDVLGKFMLDFDLEFLGTKPFPFIYILLVLKIAHFVLRDCYPLVPPKDFDHYFSCIGESSVPIPGAGVIKHGHHAVWPEINDAKYRIWEMQLAVKYYADQLLGNILDASCIDTSAQESLRLPGNWKAVKCKLCKDSGERKSSRKKKNEVYGCGGGCENGTALIPSAYFPDWAINGNGDFDPHQTRKIRDLYQEHYKASEAKHTSQKIAEVEGKMVELLKRRSLRTVPANNHPCPEGYRSPAVLETVKFQKWLAETSVAYKIREKKVWDRMMTMKAEYYEYVKEKEDRMLKLSHLHTLSAQIPETSGRKSQILSALQLQDEFESRKKVEKEQEKKSLKLAGFAPQVAPLVLPEVSSVLSRGLKAPPAAAASSASTFSPPLKRARSTAASSARAGARAGAGAGAIATTRGRTGIWESLAQTFKEPPAADESGTSSYRPDASYSQFSGNSLSLGSDDSRGYLNKLFPSKVELRGERQTVPQPQGTPGQMETGGMVTGPAPRIDSGKEWNECTWQEKQLLQDILTMLITRYPVFQGARMNRASRRAGKAEKKILTPEERAQKEEEEAAIASGRKKKRNPPRQRTRDPNLPPRTLKERMIECDDKELQFTTKKLRGKDRVRIGFSSYSFFVTGCKQFCFRWAQKVFADKDKRRGAKPEVDECCHGSRSEINFTVSLDMFRAREDASKSSSDTLSLDRFNKEISQLGVRSGPTPQPMIGSPFVVWQGCSICKKMGIKLPPILVVPATIASRLWPRYQTAVKELVLGAVRDKTMLGNRFQLQLKHDKDISMDTRADLRELDMLTRKTKKYKGSEHEWKMFSGEDLARKVTSHATSDPFASGPSPDLFSKAIRPSGVPRKGSLKSRMFGAGDLDFSRFGESIRTPRRT